MKRIIASIGLLLLSLAGLQAQDVRPYLKAEELPNATVFLPAPPEDGSPILAADTLMYQWAKKHLRMGTRGQQAIREATTNVDTMALYFSGAFGRLLTEETTPKTLHLLRRSIRTFRLSTPAPKAAYMRLRPFVYYREPTLIPAFDEGSRHSGSYPSGHSVRGWGMALVLAALNPARQDAILLEGYEWGQSRVIAGYHWQSDVDASRNLASACFARMTVNEDFQKDFAAAKAELEALGQEKQLDLGGNPIITHMYSADPSAHVFGDSLYLYPSHDRDKALNFDMEDYHCYVTADMKTFHDRGVIFNPAKQTSWAKDRAWAPDCVERNGKYYLYYPTDVRHIGVAVADSPYGPFKDPLGHPLLSIDSPGVVCDRDFIDPCVFIDDDGQAYMFVGQNTVCCIKLNEDMISYDGQVHIIQGAKGFFEAAWVHKYNGKYYLSYSTSGLGGNLPEIAYAISDNPLGPYEYKGRILGPVNSGTNHHSIVQFKGDWYLFYHTADLAIQNWPADFGKWLFHRSVCVDRLFYKADGTIQEVYPTMSSKKLETNTAFKEAY